MLRNKKTGELREPPDAILWTRWQESGEWEQVGLVKDEPKSVEEPEPEKPMSKESKKRVARGSIDDDRTAQ